MITPIKLVSSAELAAASAAALTTFDAAGYAAAIFQPYHDKLAALTLACAEVDYDITTPAGMAFAIANRAGYRDDIRIDGDKTRAERKAPLLAIERAIDAGYRALVAANAPHEERWDQCIKTENARKEADRAARIAAERERVEAIKRDIRGLRELPLFAAGTGAAVIKASIATLEAVDVSADRFAELVPEAAGAVAAALDKLVAMHEAALASEEAAAAAAAARQAQLLRDEAMRAENLRQQAENARKAAELQALAESLGVDKPATVAAPPPAPEPALTDMDPTDDEIIDNYIDAFGGTRMQAMARLSRMLFV